MNALFPILMLFLVTPPSLEVKFEESFRENPYSSKKFSVWKFSSFSVVTATFILGYDET